MNSVHRKHNEAMLPFCSSLKPRLWPIATAIFTVLALLLLANIQYQRQQLFDQQTMAISNNAKVTHRLLGQLFFDQLSHLENTTRLLASQDYLQQFAGMGQNQQRTKLKQEIESMWIQQTQVWEKFRQVRFIDLAGHEVIRVNYDPATDTSSVAEKLQFKGRRHYFLNAAMLTNDQVGLTIFDLEQEHNDYVKPYLIAARFITPVLNNEGVRAGYLVVNLNIAELLNEFRHHQSMTGLKLDILSTSGHYIYTAQPELSFGHILPERAHWSLEQTNPALWQTVTAESSNGFYSGENLHAAFSPLLIQPDENTKVNQREFILLTRFDDDFVMQAIAPSLIKLNANSFATLIVIFIVSLLAAILVQKAWTVKNAKRLMLHAANGMAAAVMTDGTHQIIAVNQMFTSLLGYKADEVIGKKPMMFRSGLQSADSLQAMKNQLATKGHWRGELTYRAKSGQLLTTMQEITAIYWNSRSKSPDYYIASFVDISAQKRLEQQLRLQSVTDPLTGAFNRRRFDDEFSRLLQNSLRYPNSSFTLALVDLDHFKKINDTHGHDIGDSVLIEFVSVVSQVLRNTDFLGRIGGEEFGVLLPFTDAEGAQIVMERVREAVEQTIASPSVTCSVGLVQHTEQLSVKDIYQAADEALYQAKATGRNKVVVHQYIAEPRQAQLG
ncbi:diguanylate cyclase [Neiella sp. HB171785]|uniref:diguanylate cyclase n=1 Tax=Neiella litorisoli TaxID=2771431 RepID=A0A8J6QMZ2_9GAMM|nr:diguanylate cyclase [Neiella litorisoli]MBD1391166.1 diguanylate cyclase [Neiella litorisoli]